MKKAYFARQTTNFVEDSLYEVYCSLDDAIIQDGILTLKQATILANHFNTAFNKGYDCSLKKVQEFIVSIH